MHSWIMYSWLWIVIALCGSWICSWIVVVWYAGIHWMLVCYAMIVHVLVHGLRLWFLIMVYIGLWRCAVVQ
jgi:hypothetical protein